MCLLCLVRCPEAGDSTNIIKTLPADLPPVDGGGGGGGTGGGGTGGGPSSGGTTGKGATSVGGVSGQHQPTLDHHPVHQQDDISVGQRHHSLYE
jgi:hypothetical protein